MVKFFESAPSALFPEQNNFEHIYQTQAAFEHLICLN